MNSASSSSSEPRAADDASTARLEGRSDPAASATLGSAGRQASRQAGRKASRKAGRMSARGTTGATGERVGGEA